MISVTSVVLRGYRADAVKRINFNRSRSVTIPAIAWLLSVTINAPMRCSTILANASPTDFDVSIVQMGACSFKYSFSARPLKPPRFCAKTLEIRSWAPNRDATRAQKLHIAFNSSFFLPSEAQPNDDENESSPATLPSL